MTKPILVILAAGMGSRYGGMKQIDGVGSHGEPIIEFSIYDAWRAGFRKVVLIIRREHEQIFRNALEQASYNRKSGAAMTSSGHLRRAIPTGSPVRTPNCFAGMDFASTTPVRFRGLPPIQEGISRRSACPSFTRRADSQERYALLTST